MRFMLKKEPFHCANNEKALRSWFEFFHAMCFSHFLMDLNFVFAVNSGLLTRKEDSKAQKKTEYSMTEFNNKNRKIKNSF